MIEGFQPSTKPPKPPRTQRKPKKDTSDKVHFHIRETCPAFGVNGTKMVRCVV